MRLPYVSDPPPVSSAEDAAIVERTRARRAPRPLQPLDLTLLHAPAMADGWNSFIGACRERSSLSPDVREIAICRVAICNGAWYEWDAHGPIAQAAGVSEAALKFIGQESLGAQIPSDLLNEKQWATLIYTDEMTRNVKVKDETFALIKNAFSSQEIVEITTLVAAYNCVSRFLVALDVQWENETERARARNRQLERSHGHLVVETDAALGKLTTQPLPWYRKRKLTTPRLS